MSKEARKNKALSLSASMHLLLAGMTFVNVSQAQEMTSLVTGVRIFEPAYYTEFDPVTALDLVQQTPGFNPQEQNGGRGLSGVRSNILINGQRPPPKGQSALQQLGGMPSTSVARIELIGTGSATAVDMQGYPQVVNVVLDEESSNYYELIAGYNKSGDGSVDQQNEDNQSLNGTTIFTWGEHEFSLRGNKTFNEQQSPATIININPANPVQRLSSVNESEREEQFLALTSDFNLGNEKSLTVNAQFFEQDNSTRPADLGSADDNSALVQQESGRGETSREFSAEYRMPIGSRSELMIAGVDSLSSDENTSSLIINGDRRSSVRDSESGERAARILFSREMSDSLTLRANATTAFNFFEGSLAIFENGVPLPIDGADSRVEEDRHSFALEADWNIADDWLFRSSVGAISYTIETRDRNTGNQTDVNGFASLAWQLMDRTTLTLESRRNIGQLSFNQFLASTELSSDILQAGAGSLEPERDWTHSLIYDQRFGDRGVLELKLTHRNVENPVSSVALSDSLVVSANANPEKITRFEASLDYPFARFGMENLILQLGGSISDSSTVDPISGETREVAWMQPYHISAGLRRNPGEGQWAWGFNIWKRGNNDNYSVRSIRSRGGFGRMNAFVDWEPINNFKLSARIEQQLDFEEETSYFPAIRQVGMTPNFITQTRSTEGQQVSLSLEYRRLKNIEIRASVTSRPDINTKETLIDVVDSETGQLLREVARTPRFNLEFRYYR